MGIFPRHTLGLNPWGFPKFALCTLGTASAASMSLVQLGLWGLPPLKDERLETWKRMAKTIKWLFMEIDDKQFSVCTIVVLMHVDLRMLYKYVCHLGLSMVPHWLIDSNLLMPLATSSIVIMWIPGSSPKWHVFGRFGEISITPSK